ncbi:hypothetical protein KC19_7G092600 [Ceratodon purpureus]|uniref:Uncharacterized protein n=1 Tax=Ceratodon purpureus TaxID=3225 RepID=A0A8T0H9I9_CERPU|nr:hypothetical protein KC19_7G092600 [Ceratodon purpureus]
MADSLYSVFDIVNGLKWPTDALALPDSIIKVEVYEHDYAKAVTQQAPILASGLDEVEEKEQVPDTGQYPSLDRQADLARALEDFQELERIKFGVHSRDDSKFRNIIDESAEDFYTSEDDSIEDLPSEGDLPIPSMGLEMKRVAQIQDKFSEASPMIP